MAPILVPFYKLLKKVIKMSIKNKQVDSKLQKSFKFGDTTYSNNASSLGKLTKAVKVAPARLSQAIDWLVSAAIEQTQWNQTSPLQQAATMLVFSDKDVLKKAGKKLLAYCKAELTTIELIEIKNTETVKVKYLVGTGDGERNLPEGLPSFSGWTPADDTKIPKAVTRKTLETLLKTFNARQKYLLENGDTLEQAKDEEAVMVHSLLDILLDITPITRILGGLLVSEDSVNILTAVLEDHKAVLAAEQREQENPTMQPEIKLQDEATQLTPVEQEVEQEKAKLKTKPKAKATDKEVA